MALKTGSWFVKCAGISQAQPGGKYSGALKRAKRSSRRHRCCVIREEGQIIGGKWKGKTKVSRCYRAGKALKGKTFPK